MTLSNQGVPCEATHSKRTCSSVILANQHPAGLSDKWRRQRTHAHLEADMILAIFRTLDRLAFRLYPRASVLNLSWRAQPKERTQTSVTR